MRLFIYVPDFAQKKTRPLLRTSLYVHQRDHFLFFATITAPAATTARPATAATSATPVSGEPLELSVAAATSPVVGAGAITVDNFVASIDYEKCIDCGACAGQCPVGAIEQA